MGGGIAQCLALAGYEVTLTDASAEAAQQNLQRLIEEAGTFAEQGLFPPDAADTMRRKLRAADSIEEGVAGVDYVQEAVPENRQLKLEVLAKIDASNTDGIIATNTSALPIGELADALSNKSRFMGVHWMNPAPFVPGVELIASEHTSDEVFEAARALVLAAGKVPAKVADVPGFVANRLQFALFKEAVKVVEEGLATPEDVDNVVSSTFGFRLAIFGPFAIGDMAGLDVYKASYDTLQGKYGDRLAAPETLSRLVAAGKIGLKAGGGFLQIPASRAAELVAYRNRAYQQLSALRADLGPAPLTD